MYISVPFEVVVAAALLAASTWLYFRADSARMTAVAPLVVCALVVLFRWMGVMS